MGESYYIHVGGERLLWVENSYTTPVPKSQSIPVQLRDWDSCMEGILG